MNARTFLHTTLVLVTLVSLEQIPTSALAVDSSQPQYDELRVYSTKSEEQQRLVSDYWQNAAIPAYNRIGIHPIGLFTELQDSLTNKIYVLIPYVYEIGAGEGNRTLVSNLPNRPCGKTWNIA